tara:strand:+ start:4113 stop:4988 length:876 start_codon:yes stop_codon:yes gene_type:complete
MSNELQIANDRGQSMAELMGVSTSGGEATPSIARVGMLHSPIMGELEVGGKTIKTEVVPVGAFILTRGDDKIYSNGITVRIFAQRQQWQRWNSETEEMEKSVLANTLSGDMKDSIGGFNLGRPSGWIDDFNALPDATKQIIRSVKRVNVYYGTVSLDNPMDASGNPLDSADYQDVAFVMDVKNRDSLKSINGVLSVLKRKNMLPIMSTVKFEGVEDSIPTGAKFGKIKASSGDKVELGEGDNEMLKDFIELVEYSNGKILDLYHERLDKGMSSDDAAMVDDILNNDFIEVS